eukprot:CCRYP_005392-RA/>CCRYP_005392-RA protein AED:0.06 eAED:0.06 QI:0/-1/0/1/-1/1/1/0/459
MAMKVISSTSELGTIPSKGVLGNIPAKNNNFVEQREDGVPELDAVSGADSMDSLEAGRMSYEENVNETSSAPTDTSSYHTLPAVFPPACKALSARNIAFADSVTADGCIDLKFTKKMDEEGYKELLLFLQAPSSVILKQILEYQPAASFGFVKNHIFDGLSDDESPEYDADEDYTSTVFPNRTREIDVKRAAMPVAVRHFTPDPAKKEKVVYEKTPAPVAVRHFTPEWETELPPTVRESLDRMSPEERAKWVSRPIAVQHFTSKPDEIIKSEVAYTAYEMPIAMKHFAPEPKEEIEFVPEPMPPAMRHFTPDWEAEAAKKREANQIKEPAPIAVQHFTPEWEVFIPPTIRESLANMTPEERKKWAETPIAVSHFTPYQAPKPISDLEVKEVPIAIRKFTPDPNAAPHKIDLKWDEMPVATRHFTPDPNAKKEYIPEPMPVAVRHFTPDWESEKAMKSQN